jgi:hypothetical protein
MLVRGSPFPGPLDGGASRRLRCASDHVAGIPARHPEMVALGRHHGRQVETCAPFGPGSKGGAEATVKIAKADPVPSSSTTYADTAPQ